MRSYKNQIESVFEQTPNYMGAFLVVFVAFLTTISNSLIHSMPPHVHAFQALFLKTSISCGFFLIINFYKISLVLKTNQLGTHFVKGLCGFLGSFFLISALKTNILDLSTCNALSLTSAIITTLGAYIFFGEKIKLSMFIAICMGFLGVLVILRPLKIFNIEIFFPVFSALAFSISSLLTKKVTLNDSIETTLFYLLAFMCVLSFPFAIYFWVFFSIITWFKFLLVACIYLITQLCLTKAYNIAAAGFIAPFKFVRFPFAIVLGWIYFEETPTSYSIVGAIMIILSCIVIDASKKVKVYGTK